MDDTDGQGEQIVGGDAELTQHDMIARQQLIKQGMLPIVEVRHLNKAYGEHVILDDVSYEFFAGQIVVIVGRSGSGKSTLLRTIAGLTELDAGSILIDGVTVVDDGEESEDWQEMRSRIGMIFQSYTLWPHLSVFRNLALAPSKVLHMDAGEIRNRAKSSLTAVGMEDYIDVMPSTLSGGQRQRVAIARALMMNPRVLLCDEITSALDPPVAADVLSVLTRLKEEENLAVILVTHDMSFAAHAADRVLFFNQGHIDKYGSFDEARHAVDNVELQSFIKAIAIS
ncbi:MAG: amino acid ABC transporter ATP-binding protein [Bifidobacterium sp.]